MCCKSSAVTASAFRISRRGCRGTTGTSSRSTTAFGECLNCNYCTSLLEARVAIEGFQDDHNNRHRHSSLGYLTPAEYAARCTHNDQPVEGCEIA